MEQLGAYHAYETNHDGLKDGEQPQQCVVHWECARNLWVANHCNHGDKATTHGCPYRPMVRLHEGLDTQRWGHEKCTHRCSDG